MTINPYAARLYAGLGFPRNRFRPSATSSEVTSYSMSGYWQNKNVVVTGASSGLGLAIARKYAEAGASVVLVARNPERLKETSASVLNSLAIPCDITNGADVSRLFDLLSERGALHAFVNAAGRSSRGRILDTSVRNFQELLDLNFLAVVRCCRRAAPLLLSTGGHLVNIGSLASKTASRFLGAYPASKFALAAYTQQLRLELGPDGLHVLLVCPGPIRRDDAGTRYANESSDLPADASKPGGGANLKLISADVLASKILKACEHRKSELVVPGKAKLLFALAQILPALADRILLKRSA